MKGFAMKKIGEVGWVEKDEPKYGPYDAIVKPIALAPCTSDIHTVWEGAVGERTDMILGHEALGVVDKVGSEVKDFKPGDRVIVPAITPDWYSDAALRGFSSQTGGALGGWKFSNFKDGVFGEYFHVNDADGNLALLPDGMDLSAACMLSDMVPTGMLGVEMADIHFGDKVCVVGIGPVGLMAVAGAAIRGASDIFAIGSRPNCVQVAKEFGATEIINYKDGDIVTQVLELTKGYGTDCVIIAGGDNDTFDQAVRMVKPSGRISNINYLGEGDYIKIPRVEWGVGMGHKKIIGGLMLGGRLRMEQYAALVKTKRIDPGRMVTHTLNGFDKVEDALMLMKDKPSDLIKPVVIL